MGERFFQALEAISIDEFRQLDLASLIDILIVRVPGTQAG